MWPLKRQIDLSSGFGDFRQNRFHAGLDIRTGGKIGAELFSPVDGYVWRARTSYDGYGKGLYVRGDDGFFYVYGHLSQFADDVAAVVRSEQLRTKRYYVDLYFPQDSLRVKAGQLIGFTGKTGTGAPHLHFEKRTAENLPVNPLSHGYALKDKTRPVFRRVGFIQRDKQSLFGDGSRYIYYDVKEQKPGKYVFDTVLYFNNPFGVAVDCFDMMRTGGMQQSAHKVTLYIDKEPYYSITFDTLDFALGRLVDLNYDYLQAVNDHRRVLVLFHKPGNDYPGARVLNGFDGVVGAMPSLKIGRHRASVVAEDAFGNKSELSFQFLWGPSDHAFVLDSTVQPDDKNTLYYLSLTPGSNNLDIKEVLVQANENRQWGTTDALKAERKGDMLIVRAAGIGLRYRPLRLVLYAGSGCRFVDNVFAGINSGPIKFPEINYAIVEDGIVFYVEAQNLRSSEMLLRLYNQGQMLAAFPMARFVNMKDYVFFVPADPRFRRIDHVDVSPTEDMAPIDGFGQDVDIFLVDGNDRTITVDSTFFIHVLPQGFYSPQYIGLEKHEIVRKMQLRLNSNHYEILPEAFVTREDFTVSCTIDSTAVSPERTGICWLDKTGDKWVWLEDNSFDGRVMSAGSQGGGSFAAVIDSRAPQISDINLLNGGHYQNPRPPIQFKLSDDLSGIEDDRSIQITIDDQWLIPEYDPESQICSSFPVDELTWGEHVLTIKAVDRAGNTNEKQVKFTIGVK